MGRFEQELEFVQCLCNPQYLQHLYQKGYFKDAQFVSFLRYLTYWNKPEYAKYLLFPQCLDILHLLVHSPEFVESLKYKQLVEHLALQQYLQWKHRK